MLLCPVGPCAAVPIDETGGLAGIPDRKLTINGKTRPYTDFFGWAGLIIVADLPVTVVPLGVLSSGLPVGVQIVAREWHDKTALQVGRILERLHPGSRVVPPPGYADAARPAKL